MKCITRAGVRWKAPASSTSSTSTKISPAPSLLNQAEKDTLKAPPSIPPLRRFPPSRPSWEKADTPISYW